MKARIAVRHVVVARSRRAAVTLGTTAAMALVMTACGGVEGSKVPGNGLGVVGGDLPEVLATVGDVPITAADLPTAVREELALIETQYRRARSRTVESALDGLVRDRLIDLETRARGVTAEELVTQEAGGSLVPSELEIDAWYKENQVRLGGRGLNELRDQIRDHLRGERRQQAEARLQQRLIAEHKVTVNFEPARFVHDNDGAPYLGGRDAQVTLVEFSDFECPYCSSFAPTLKLLNAEFGDDLKIVYRQFPITSIHPSAFKAAEASLCAHEQGRFWQMHDLMFQEQNRVTVSDLKEKARRLGLDGRKFDSCLDTGRYVERVQNDIREAQGMGVNGTPALFVNGAPVEGGAVPYETVAAAIRKEIARLAR